MTQRVTEEEEQLTRGLMRRRRRVPPGSAPGTLIADPDARAPRIQLFAYGQDSLEEREIEDVANISEWIGKSPVLWVNVDGLGDLDLIHRLGELFGHARLR